MARRPTDPAALRWGILGAAGIADTMIPAIRASGCGTVVAVASRDGHRARAFAAGRAIPHAVAGYERLLDPDLVDVVYNPLPNSLHAAWTTRCLQAGLPVLCEKPFTRNAAEARAVAAAATAAGLPVVEAFMYRFHPLYDRVRALVAGGDLGEVVSITACFTFFLDDRAALPAQAALAGGALMDVGCYGVDLARQVVGDEPRRAVALARGRDVDDTFLGILEFPDGVLASVECSIASYERHRAVIAGTRGAVVLDAPWLPGPDGGRFHLLRGGRDEVVETPGGDPYVLEVQDFARACTGAAPPRWPVADAVANMAALDALRAAAASGQAVAVAPAGAPPPAAP